MSVVLAQQPAPPATRARRLLGPAATIGTLSLLTLALHARDPHQHGSWGFCPSAAMGVYCPGCGGLRAVNDLTHGQLGAAASSNLLLIVAMPVVVLLLGRWCLDAWTGRVRDHSIRLAGWSTAVVLVAMVAFTIARNLPAGAWLAP
jgi:hypothetical protein